LTAFTLYCCKKMEQSKSWSQSDVFRKTEKKFERTDTLVKMKPYSAATV